MSCKFAAIVASCLLAPAMAAAQAGPTWVEAPSAADMAAAYPAKAKAAAIGGAVQMICTINREGHLRSCEVLDEKPGNYGFGTAARKVAEKLRVNETNLRGQVVRVPMTFNPAVLKAGGPTITKLTWAAMPSAEDFQATFPKTANGVNTVRVVLACTVQDGGALGDCTVDSESPAGEGYGAGALALASKFRAGPWSQDGQPTVGAHLKLPIRYELAQVAALAPSVGSALAQDVQPTWLKKPTAEDLLGVWPTAALKSGAGGKAVIQCIVTLQGALRACTPIFETPPGLGFGAAGVTLSAQFLMKPGTHNGQPVEGTVRIPIAWADTLQKTGSRVKQPMGADFNADKVVSSVRWLQAPSFSDVLAAYPEKARAQKLSGHATLDCEFSRTGMLTNCNVLQETPSLLGFGAAARRLAPKFVGPTADSKGASLFRARVQLPFVFAAESLSATSPVIGRPQWAAIPSGGELMAAYPSDAAKAGVLKARVVLGCQVIADGALSGCAVESEDPAGHGIGKATLALSPTFRLGIWTPEGLPAIGGTVHVPIRYDITDEPQPAKP